MSTKSGHSCTHCQKSFIRPEHLRRHIRSVHDDQGISFRCEECGKTFNRADSCRRHKRSHDSHDQAQSTARVVDMAKATPRVRRACQNCATARTKCTGVQPCSRCRVKELECTYTTRAPWKSRSTVEMQGQTADSRLDHMLGEDATHDAAASQETRTATPIVDQTVHIQDANVDDGCNLASVPDAYHSRAPALHGNDNLGWNDSINWLPVADNIDLSLLFGMDSGIDAISQVWPTEASSRDQDRSENMESSSRDASDDEYTSSIEKTSSLYAAGRGSRRSFLAIPKPRLPRHEAGEDGTLPVLEFPTRLLLPAIDQKSEVNLNLDIYNMIVEKFHLLCTCQIAYGRRFTSKVFPSSEESGRLLGLYLRHFHPHFPFIHRMTWCDSTAPWILVLAAATMGSTYNVEPESLQITLALSEFLRRALRMQLDSNEQCDPLPLTQASLIHAIVQASNPIINITRAAQHDFALAMEVYEGSVLLFPLDQIDVSQAFLKWQTWLAHESDVRLKWMAWLWRAFLTSVNTQQQYLSLPEQDLTLPCHCTLWEAITVDDWLVRAATVSPASTLLASMHSMFVRLRAPPHLDDFEGALLCHVILARTSEVERTVQQPLHTWSPGPAGCQKRQNHEIDFQEDGPAWLPADPRYASWRNSACDSLDVLHWTANAKAFNSHGIEGPLILHLHLVRLLLLCPYKKFLLLASALHKRTKSPGHGLPIASQLDESILRWLTMDDHKGRLCLVHAGAVFWHLRRYARGHFHEPFCIYLAALTIWIYGVYLPQVRGHILHIKQINVNETAQNSLSHSRSSRNSSEDDDDDLTPDTILLDRPCDDEMVQTFVRRGHTMQADMSGAPDICLPSSQKFVLKEAIKLLRRPQYQNLMQSQTYRVVLQRLVHFV